MTTPCAEVPQTITVLMPRALSFSSRPEPRNLSGPRWATHSPSRESGIDDLGRLRLVADQRIEDHRAGGARLIVQLFHVRHRREAARARAAAAPHPVEDQERRPLDRK